MKTFSLFALLFGSLLYSNTGISRSVSSITVSPFQLTIEDKSSDRFYLEPDLRLSCKRRIKSFFSLPKEHTRSGSHVVELESLENGVFSSNSEAVFNNDKLWNPSAEQYEKKGEDLGCKLYFFIKFRDKEVPYENLGSFEGQQMYIETDLIKGNQSWTSRDIQKFIGEFVINDITWKKIDWYGYTRWVMVVKYTHNGEELEHVDSYRVKGDDSGPFTK